MWSVVHERAEQEKGIRTWHDPSSDVPQLRSQNPPASVVGLLRWVAIEHESSKAGLPEADIAEPRVDARPRYVPVGRREGDNQRNEAEKIQYQRSKQDVTLARPQLHRFLLSKLCRFTFANYDNHSPSILLLFLTCGAGEKTNRSRAQVFWNISK